MTAPRPKIVDLFAGFGWSEGLATLGLHDVGLELNADACATRAALGHLTIRCDVATYPKHRFRGVEGLIASPPCQDFSVAGKQAGRTGDRGRLIDTVPEWVEELRPEWVACEQVPPCVGIWKEHAHRYRELDYSTWVGVLNSADYGVPQTRKRAFLMASRVAEVVPPNPTHARAPEVGLFETRRPWVTMAEALGWGMTGRPSVTLTGGSNRQGGPSPLDGGSGARAALRRERDAGRWELDRRQNGAPILDPEAVPSPTMTGAAIGNGVCSLTRDGESVRLTVADALILQSFRPDLPLVGSRSSQFLQIGNAVPPVMAAAIVGQLADLERLVAA